jgi:hypothetical protein
MLEDLTIAIRRVRESAQAVGAALSAVSVYTEPAIARAVQAEHNLYARIFASAADQIWLIDLCAPLHVDVLLQPR